MPAILPPQGSSPDSVQRCNTCHGPIDIQATAWFGYWMCKGCGLLETECPCGIDKPDEKQLGLLPLPTGGEPPALYFLARLLHLKKLIHDHWWGMNKGRQELLGHAVVSTFIDIRETKDQDVTEAARIILEEIKERVKHDA